MENDSATSWPNTLGSIPSNPLNKADCLILALPFISFLLLAAHFLRQTELGLALFLVGSALSLFLRRSFLRIVLAGALLLGCLAWADAAATFISFRIQAGLPWIRLSLIMTSVFALTLGSAIVLLFGPGQRWFSIDKHTAWLQASIFASTVLILGLLRFKVNIPLLLADRFFPGLGWFQIWAVALYAALIGGAMATPRHTIKLRPKIWLAFSIIFFGQLALGLMGFEKMLMTGPLHLPVPALIVAGPIYRGQGMFMLFLFLGSVALLGSAWCSHFCYIGAWDQLACRGLKSSNPLPSWTTTVRWIVLGLVISTTLILHWLTESPTLAFFLALAFGLGGILVMLTWTRKIGIMTHCTVYCPLGLMADVLGRLTPWRIKISEDCTRCGACAKVCRYNALNEIQIEKQRPGLTCSLCGDCLSACAHGAIHYSLPGVRPERARTIFLFLAVTLHAVFLAVARI